MKRLLLIHDLCSAGKAGMMNMIPILNGMGVEVCPIPTMLLSTHTGGYGKPAVLAVPGTYVEDCLRHYEREGIRFDAVFIGYLGSAAMAEKVFELLEKMQGIPVIFDPIMGDHGKYYSNFDDSYCSALRRLASCADVLLPNMTEASFLSGKPYRDEADDNEVLDMAKHLTTLGAGTVVITSAVSGKEKIRTAIWEKGIFEIQEREKVPYMSHGTGDLFDGVFAGVYITGAKCGECVKKASDFVADCLQMRAEEGTPERDGLPFETLLRRLV